MNPHQAESTILAFSVAFLLGLLTSSVIDWAFKEKPQTEFHSEGQRIQFEFTQSEIGKLREFTKTNGTWVQTK